MTLPTTGPEAVAFANRIIDAQSFSTLIGARFEDITPGHATLRVPLRDDLKQHHGFAHGGLMAAMADISLTFMGAAALGPNVLTMNAPQYDEADFLNGAATLAEERGRGGVPPEIAYVDAYNEMRFLMLCSSPAEWGRRDDVDHAFARAATLAIHPAAPQEYFDWVNDPSSAATPGQVSDWADALLSTVDTHLRAYAQGLPPELLAELLAEVLRRGHEENALFSGEFPLPPLES